MKLSPKAKPKPVGEGMLETFSLGSYLLLVEYTGRLYRNGKARMSTGLKDVFERLGSSEEFFVEFEQSRRIFKEMLARTKRNDLTRGQEGSKLPDCQSVSLCPQCPRPFDLENRTTLF